MHTWWLAPLIRLLAALGLPFLVPAVVTIVIWALPGDPASIICPPELCGGTDVLAKHWNLDKGPVHFFLNWVKEFFAGDLGKSWRYQQGVDVNELLSTAVPNTLILLFLSGVTVFLGGVLGGAQVISRRWDSVLIAAGVLPVIVLSLIFSAMIILEFGAGASFDGLAYWFRMGAAAITLGFSDGAFSGAVTGFREMVGQERRERYVEISILRGENELSNALPNILSALGGQLRGRLLQLLSALVIVEVVLQIDGVGALLWGGTLLQDFGLVLGSAAIFALISSFLLALQAFLEIAVAIYIRRSPSGVELEAAV
ncbi:MAG: hypothetical protein CMK59_09360 [Proteobacteria bacterium]|nr:hypothetical protein [Pseudomonadota bacterium]